MSRGIGWFRKPGLGIVNIVFDIGGPGEWALIS
jgi:hypothetical protein